MDFRDTPEEAEFRARARAALEQAASEMPAHLGSTVEERVVPFRQFQRAIHTAGYAGMSWPREYGGRGASLSMQAIYLQEYDRAGGPDRMNVIGEGMVGPTIIDFGSEEMKRRLLEPILTGEHIWCQLFSEPGAGSDLAALETKAERSGEGWAISGQKVWTSRAQIAEYGILLARTGGPPTHPRQRHGGITYFILPMHQDGVEVRPLRHMLGEAEFNEVFLDGAHIPDELRVGEVDAGWKVAMATLGYERAILATGRINVQRLVGDLIELVRTSTDSAGRPLGEDPTIRRKVADLYARAQIQRVNGLRALASMERGAPGPEASIGKLYSSPLAEEIGDFALSVLGPQAELQEALDGEAGRWLRLAYQARGTSIAGGTTFIQRNIVAQRVLGLPRG